MEEKPVWERGATSLQGQGRILHIKIHQTRLSEITGQFRKWLNIRSYPLEGESSLSTASVELVSD